MLKFSFLFSIEKPIFINTRGRNEEPSICSEITIFSVPNHFCDNQSGTMADWTCIYFILMCTITHGVGATGRMLVPPQRSSLWRDPIQKYNPRVAKNFEDHRLNCGGLWVSYFNHILPLNFPILSNGWVHFHFRGYCVLHAQLK